RADVARPGDRRRRRVRGPRTGARCPRGARGRDGRRGQRRIGHPRSSLTRRRGRDNAGMGDRPRDTVGFRLWPPVSIGAPLLAGWLVTLNRGDPGVLGEWRVPLGWALVLFFVGWNVWSLWLFARHRTGLLPGQPTAALIEEGPYGVSRNPLYVGLLALYVGLALLAPTFWGLVLLPAAVLLLLWGAIRPEERYLHERFGDRYDAYARRVRRWFWGGRAGKSPTRDATHT